MGVTATYKKRSDIDQWEADIRNFRAEISQDADGNWQWVLFDRNWKGPILEIKGVTDTQRRAEYAAQKWAVHLSMPRIG